MVEEEQKENSVWQGLWLNLSLLFKHCPPGSQFGQTTQAASAAFSPLRGLIVAIIVLIPIMLIGSIPRVDTHYFRLLIPFIYWGLMEKITHKRRLQAFCKCCEAINDPDKAARIMHNPGNVPLTAAGGASLVLLLGGKLMVLYLLVVKHVISSESAGQLQFIMLLCAIPVLAELGPVLLLAGDQKPVHGPELKPSEPAKPKPMWPVAVAAVLAVPMCAALWFLASPNSLIMPLSLILIMVFYWKRMADSVLGGANETVAWACYETCEVAATLGLLIVYQVPLQLAIEQLKGMFSFIL